MNSGTPGFALLNETPPDPLEVLLAPPPGCDPLFPASRPTSPTSAAATATSSAPNPPLEAPAPIPASESKAEGLTSRSRLQHKPGTVRPNPVTPSPTRAFPAQTLPALRGSKSHGAIRPKTRDAPRESQPRRTTKSTPHHKSKLELIEDVAAQFAANPVPLDRPIPAALQVTAPFTGHPGPHGSLQSYWHDTKAKVMGQKKRNEDQSKMKDRAEPEKERGRTRSVKGFIRSLTPGRQPGYGPIPDDWERIDRPRRKKAPKEQEPSPVLEVANPSSMTSTSTSPLNQDLPGPTRAADPRRRSRPLSSFPIAVDLDNFQSQTLPVEPSQEALTGEQTQTKDTTEPQPKEPTDTSPPFLRLRKSFSRLRSKTAGMRATPNDTTPTSVPSPPTAPVTTPTEAPDESTNELATTKKGLLGGARKSFSRLRAKSLGRIASEDAPGQTGSTTHPRTKSRTRAALEGLFDSAPPVPPIPGAFVNAPPVPPTPAHFAKASTGTVTAPPSTAYTTNLDTSESEKTVAVDVQTRVVSEPTDIAAAPTDSEGKVTLGSIHVIVDEGAESMHDGSGPQDEFEPDSSFNYSLLRGSVYGTEGLNFAADTSYEVASDGSPVKPQDAAIGVAWGPPSQASSKSGPSPLPTAQVETSLPPPAATWPATSPLISHTTLRGKSHLTDIEVSEKKEHVLGKLYHPRHQHSTPRLISDPLMRKGPVPLSERESSHLCVVSDPTPTSPTFDLGIKETTAHASERPGLEPCQSNPKTLTHKSDQPAPLAAVSNIAAEQAEADAHARALQAHADRAVALAEAALGPASPANEGAEFGHRLKHLGSSEGLDTVATGCTAFSSAQSSSSTICSDKDKENTPPSPSAMRSHPTYSPGIFRAPNPTPLRALMNRTASRDELPSRPPLPPQWTRAITVKCSQAQSEARSPLGDITPRTLLALSRAEFLQPQARTRVPVTHASYQALVAGTPKEEEDEPVLKKAKSRWSLKSNREQTVAPAQAQDEKKARNVKTDKTRSVKEVKKKVQAAKSAKSREIKKAAKDFAAAKILSLGQKRGEANATGTAVTTTTTAQPQDAATGTHDDSTPTAATNAAWIHIPPPPPPTEANAPELVSASSPASGGHSRVARWHDGHTRAATPLELLFDSMHNGYHDQGVWCAVGGAPPGAEGEAAFEAAIYELQSYDVADAVFEDAMAELDAFVGEEGHRGTFGELRRRNPVNLNEEAAAGEVTAMDSQAALVQEPEPVTTTEDQDDVSVYSYASDYSNASDDPVSHFSSDTESNAYDNSLSTVPEDSREIPFHLDGQFSDADENEVSADEHAEAGIGRAEQ